MVLKEENDTPVKTARNRHRKALSKTKKKTTSGIITLDQFFDPTLLDAGGLARFFYRKKSSTRFFR